MPTIICIIVRKNISYLALNVMISFIKFLLMVFLRHIAPPQPINFMENNFAYDSELAEIHTLYFSGNFTLKSTTKPTGEHFAEDLAFRYGTIQGTSGSLSENHGFQVVCRQILLACSVIFSVLPAYGVQILVLRHIQFS